MQKLTENQHYVPRFYMKQFSNVVNIGKKNENALVSGPSAIAGRSSERWIYRGIAAEI